ncbi:HNH endonuclease [Enterobacter hormaechei]|uniref:HNH endonuclease n=1 Tax=Enterobacter hormaechei TaxID=158836 RepID=UPI0018C2165D|nr:HNH endonuclease [Enterobacter hormaechei]MBG0613194.1 HNH endonuclease [Enterobacter hormaechei]
MAKLKYTVGDVSAIRRSIAEGGDVWYNKKLAGVKKNIKKHFKDKCLRCCYCQRSFKGEFDLVIDIEHILPQSLYAKYMFFPKNLSIACKRCNMKIKKASVKFIVDGYHKKRIFNKSTYKFIHPNLDAYNKHITRINIELENLSITKYVVKNNSQKGFYTYRFFRLFDFECQDFDLAQGLPIIERYI